MKKQILLVGAYHEMIELCESCGYEVAGIFDNKFENEYYGIKILGTDAEAEKLFHQYGNIPVVVTPYMPTLREKLVKMYAAIGYKFATIISPEARISKYSTIGEGSVIQAGVNVAANTHIGKFVKLNTMCNIMHDDEIGDFVTVSPNAVTLGYVTIEDRAFLGANCTILPNLTVGERAVVGAGSVVTKNVEANKVVKGSPAK